MEYQKRSLGEVEGSTEEWVQTDKLCHQNDTEKFYSGSRIVKVLFHSDYSVNRTGFKGQAKTVCGGSIVNIPNGIITDDGPWRDCQWNITVKPGRTINITFEKFLIHGEQPCTSNYIFFRDGGGPESPYLGTGKYCGDKIITVPETISNRLYIYYKATNTEGFIMRFQEKSVECGGTIMLNEDWRSSSITSPNYPNVPPPHTECTWLILAPSGESIHFEVSKRFDLEDKKGCPSEYLELRDGSSERSHFIGRYCSRPPSFVVTEGNALFIKYFTDINLPKDGFNATVSLCEKT